MTSKLSLFAAAFAVLGGGATQAHAYESGYLPPPAYAYSQYPTYDYAEGGYEKDCGDRFTLAGAHAGVTVLSIDLDGGARLAVGGGCHHHHHPVRYAAPPAPPAPPPGYGYPAYAPPQPMYQQPMYQQPAYAPPPPMPCGCEHGPHHGW